GSRPDRARSLRRGARHRRALPRTGRHPRVIELSGLRVEVGGFVVPALDLAIEKGTYFVLLGPSGHGKSVILETVAGLRRPSAGRIRIGGRDVTELPPEARSVGYVVQGAALFPHLSVLENIAFPLRVTKRPARLVASKAAEAAELTGV